MDSAPTATTTRKAESTSASRETLTVTDNRTGRSYEVPITHGTIRASIYAKIKVDPKNLDDELRSGVQQHGFMHQPDNLYRW